MTVLEFVEKYNSMTSEKIKEQMIQDRVTRHYSPIVEKRIALQALLDNAVSDGYVDMVLSRVNYTLSLPILYTDLDIDVSETGASMRFEIYDALMQSGLVEKLCMEIGEAEVEELNTINSLLIQNFETKVTSTGAVIKKAAELISNAFEVLGNSEVLKEALNEKLLE